MRVPKSPAFRAVPFGIFLAIFRILDDMRLMSADIAPTVAADINKDPGGAGQGLHTPFIPK